MRNEKGQFVGNQKIEHSCKQCQSTFFEYASCDRKFCNSDCYYKNITLGERLGKLSVTERQSRYRKRIRNKTHDICVCGKEKLTRALKCHSCTHTGRRPANYKGGYSNHLKHNRERYQKLKIRGGHTDDEWSELKKKFGYMCLCCKKVEPAIKLTRDHIIPISQGGSDNIDNIQPLCLSCNIRKYTSIINYIELHEINKAGEKL